MNSKDRMLQNWNCREVDRVPIEMYLYPPAQGLPGAEKIKEFEETEADNFRWVPGIDWGFLGLDTVSSEEVIEDVPGAFKRVLYAHSTPVGNFTAIAKYNYDDCDVNDCHWEKRFIETLDDFRRVAEAERRVRPFNLNEYNKGCLKIGNRGLPCTGLLHPLGILVRHSNMEEVYAWMLAEEKLTMKFLEKSNDQVAESVLAIENESLAYPPIFMTYALEMLIPPWMGKYHFEKFVFPFDKKVNDAIHKIGGRHRAHCHGNSGAFLELFAEMGIDGLEPLEPAPFGDNDLADAKKRVGGRMLLSGNIPSQAFYFDDIGPQQVRQMVKETIEQGKPGGGFNLKTTGGAVGNGKTKEQCIKNIECNLAIIDAWREFGYYG